MIVGRKINSNRPSHDMFIAYARRDSIIFKRFLNSQLKLRGNNVQPTHCSDDVLAWETFFHFERLFFYYPLPLFLR